VLPPSLRGWVGCTDWWTLFHCSGKYEAHLTGAPNDSDMERCGCGPVWMAEGTVRVLFPVYWIHNQSEISWGASPIVPPRRRVDREG
jgi:hypothetical protein